MTITPIQDSPQKTTQRITLHNVSWQTYKSLLADLGDHRTITSPSTRRVAIYKSLEVPEVWRYTQQAFQIYQFQNGEYVLCENSPTFPIISAATINQFLQQIETMDDDNTVIRSLRIWIRDRLKQQTN